MKQVSYLLALSILVCSCKKDNESPVECPSSNETRVHLVNEGNFNQGNAEIGTWSLESNTYSPESYAEINGEPLGDILQSYYDMGEKIFWVVNNSGKIVVTDRGLNKLGEITGLTSPRYFMPVSDELAYVTDLYSGSIAVVNHNSYTVDHQITVPVELTDKLFVSNGNCYIVGSTLVDTENWVYEYDMVKINIESEEVTRVTSPATIHDALFHMGNEMMLSASNEDGIALYSYNTDTDSFTEMNVGLEGLSISHIAENMDDDILYALIDGDLHEVNVNSNSTNMLSDLNLTYGYGLAYDEFSGAIYVCDAENFGETGTVYRLNEEGEVLNEIVSGPLPRGVFVP